MRPFSFMQERCLLERAVDLGVGFHSRSALSQFFSVMDQRVRGAVQQLRENATGDVLDLSRGLFSDGVCVRARVRAHCVCVQVLLLWKRKQRFACGGRIVFVALNTTAADGPVILWPCRGMPRAASDSVFGEFVVSSLL